MNHCVQHCFDVVHCTVFSSTNSTYATNFTTEQTICILIHRETPPWSMTTKTSIRHLIWRGGKVISGRKYEALCVWKTQVLNCGRWEISKAWPVLLIELFQHDTHNLILFPRFHLVYFTIYFVSMGVPRISNKDTDSCWDLLFLFPSKRKEQVSACSLWVKTTFLHLLSINSFCSTYSLILLKRHLDSCTPLRYVGINITLKSCHTPLCSLLTRWVRGSCYHFSSLGIRRFLSGAFLLLSQVRSFVINISCYHDNDAVVWLTN